MVPERNLCSGEELLSDVPDFGIAVGCAEASFVLNAMHTVTVMSELYLTSVCGSFYVKIKYICKQKNVQLISYDSHFASNDFSLGMTPTPL